jgi:hypothetical protein
MNESKLIGKYVGIYFHYLKKQHAEIINVEIHFRWQPEMPSPLVLTYKPQVHSLFIRE